MKRKSRSDSTASVKKFIQRYTAYYRSTKRPFSSKLTNARVGQLKSEGSLVKKFQTQRTTKKKTKCWGLIQMRSGISIPYSNFISLISGRKLNLTNPPVNQKKESSSKSSKRSGKKRKPSKSKKLKKTRPQTTCVK